MNHLARTAGRTKSVVAQPYAASLAVSSLSRLFSSSSHKNSTDVNEPIQQRSNEDASTASTAAELRKEDINRLLYRARQRGWLELDLIIGRWAKRNLQGQEALPRSVIQDLELLLTQENPDLFKWLTGQLPTPPEMLQNSAFRLIKADLDRGIEINGSRTASTPAGTAWVRGWGDTGTPGGSAPLERGNQE